VTGVRIHEVTMTAREPLRAAWGTLRERPLLVLEIEGDDGVIGYGEAAPLEDYDGVGLEEVRRALGLYARVLRDFEGPPRGVRVVEECRREADLPQALVAVEMALWDRGGKRDGRSLAHLIAGDPLDHVPVNASISALDRAGAAAAAAAAAADGYSCVKVKVGIGDDAGRVAAVRAAAGPHMAIRLDANGAWTVDEAVRAIEALSATGLELVEEPVHGVDALREVRERVTVRIAIDESVPESGGLATGAADAVCLKLARAGGISMLLSQASLVRALGADVYLTSSYDGPLGVAAALHCAAALRVTLPCGLATLRLFDVPDPMPVHDGLIAVPTGPGLGVEPYLG
jgi:L-alanine-DL-glutamate epimerase-like enolase superfamily enzyme